MNSIEPPKTGYVLKADARLPGFGVRVTANGVRSFVLNYRCAGRLRRITIGRYPDWTVAAARKRASELRREVDVGIDPMTERQSAISAPTVRDLFDRYCRDHLPKKRASSQKTDIAMFRNMILPAFGASKVNQITYDHCDSLHRKISKRTPIQANRVVGLLRKSFNLAIRWRWIDANPAIGIVLNPETKRERYLSRDEIKRLHEAMDGHPEQTSCDIVRFLILTGCRSGEAFRARWEQFDGDLRIWTKPASTTKQKRLHRVPVSMAVSELLRRRRDGAESEWVFPSQTGKPFVSIKRTWARLCNKADIEDARLHDLRHTFASLLASHGSTLPVIGAMLGHSQANTTARYAHLFDETLAAAAETASISIS
ncbi:MAG: tyrosine-type recombinase/integrase [Rhodobacteraceae bacterium]|nr:tyrosine-type recombinase/integrase [Paracoccaceae bacterium]MBL4558843.1 tyrosine-type recombinase/integrase [Paracoccaceae bacterium]